VNPPQQGPETRDALTLNDLLLRSLEELAAAGNVEGACRLAGHACVTLRKSDPHGERRFNALLHRLTKHVSW
jgi:hypothetical protein